MLSSIVVIILFLFLLFFMFYKRDMLIKMFSIDVTSSANQFQKQLEQTADIVIQRLEEQIIHFEYLLEEANEKITKLDHKIKIANEIIEREKGKKEISPILDTTHLVIPNITIENDKLYSSNEIETIVTSEMPSLRSDKKRSVVEMADLGCDITQIAKKTGISKGEIMLLLQLNKK